MPRPLRVALIVGSLELGGTEKQVAGIARELRMTGTDVQVVVLSGHGPWAVSLDEADVPVYSLGWPSPSRLRSRGLRRSWVLLMCLARLVKVAVFMRRRRFDVAHAFLFHCYVVFVPLAWLVRVPVRISARRSLADSVRRHPVLERLVPLCNRLSSAVVANAQAVAVDTIASERLSPSKVRVLPNAVDLPTAVANVSVDPACGLMIANLHHYKGHLDVVKALARLSHPPRIRCVGDGDQWGNVERAIRAAGLSATMTLEGAIPRACDLYAGVQFALLASHSEGVPNAILEAMAAGLPVVATDVGGCAELVEDGVTGLLVPPHDPPALADAIRRIAGDREFRVSAGRIARHRAARFGWAEVAGAHLDLYQCLIQASRKG